MNEIAPDDKYRIMLLDLLAVIHRDGGHHTQDVGIKLSHEHAMRLSSERLDQPCIDNVITRNAVIEECAKALEADAQLCDCAAHSEGECAWCEWCEWKSITSARAVEIVRTPAEPDVLREVCWFVEFPEAGDRYEHSKRVGPARPMQWLAVGGRRTTNPNEAMRFCRREDAESMISIIDNGPFAFAASGATATEHIFLDALAASLRMQESKVTSAPNALGSRNEK